MTKRAWLKQFANDLTTIIAGEPGLRVLPRQHVHRTNTDGHVIKIGKLKGRRNTGVELWLDMWTHDLRLWCGLATRDSDLAVKLSSSRKPSVRPAVRLTYSDTEEYRQYSRLVNTLPATSLERPIAEAYEPWFFHGVFSDAKVMKQITAGRIHPPLLGRVADALTGMLRAAVGLLPTANEEESSTTEELKKHLQREQWIRNTRVAEERKLFDNYTCQVCEFHAPLVCAAAPSRACLEAHHVQWLSSSVEDRVAICSDDLITLCCNCHSIVHRQEWTIRQARRRFKKRAVTV
ncbi:MAG: hypothetical protein SGI92_15800 [Bryobacteraceae bacterium]|nr:hypothetical protein [Bryobacteraceae bacterium]